MDKKQDNNDLSAYAKELVAQQVEAKLRIREALRGSYDRWISVIVGDILTMINDDLERRNVLIGSLRKLNRFYNDKLLGFDGFTTYFFLEGVLSRLGLTSGKNSEFSAGGISITSKLEGFAILTLLEAEGAQIGPNLMFDSWVDGRSIMAHSAIYSDRERHIALVSLMVHLYCSYQRVRVWLHDFDKLHWWHDVHHGELSHHHFDNSLPDGLNRLANLNAPETFFDVLLASLQKGVPMLIRGDSCLGDLVAVAEYYHIPYRII